MKRSVIVCSQYGGVRKKAAEVLSRILLDRTGEYPGCLTEKPRQEQEEFRYFYLETDERLGKPQSYEILVAEDRVTIRGADETGLLYGCVDFEGRYLARAEITGNSERYFENPLEGKLPDWHLKAGPAIARRGLWTWGHVIYDWRGYLDNMVQLKMNTVVIWNDFPACNARELTDYAHECGIQVIWGYSWLWDTNCLEVGLQNLEGEAERIAREFSRDYAGLGDGIYFQSFTETEQEKIGQVLIAEAVTEFVNSTAGKILENYPDLEIQFGLHANSVRQKLDYIAKVDPRVRIVWENCGAFPFDYLPTQTEGFGETCGLVRRITGLRGPDEKCGMVLKGLTKLDWPSFRHQTGPLLMGVSSKQMQENRLERKKEIWHLVQAGWLVNGEQALEMVRLLRDQTGGDLDVTALVEDGMFEKKVYYPAALLGEMLWDCDRDYRELVYSTALRKNIEFA